MYLENIPGATPKVNVVYFGLILPSKFHGNQFSIRTQTKTNKTFVPH